MTIWKRAKHKVWIYGILVGLVVATPVAADLIGSPPPVDGVISFSWTNATERSDGTAFDPATEQADIRFYCNGDLVPSFISSGDATSLVASAEPGTYTCYARTVDTDGLESIASNTVIKVVTAPPKAPPNPPALK